MASGDPKFPCPSCGKQYKWKPEMAGRSAKCACGAKFVVPTEQPASAKAPTATAAPPVEPAKSNAGCPNCGTALPPGAVLCVNCGYNLKTGKTLSVVVEADEDEADDADAPVAATAHDDAPKKPGG